MNGAKGFRKALLAGGLRRFGARLRADTAGNVLAIGAIALLMLLAAVGGAVDISRAYVMKTNLQAACDAGVLAGRRALSKSADYGATEKAMAKKMFDFNMHAEETDSYGVVFDSEATDTGSVTGKASATMPVTIMQIFDATDIYLGVDCSAELQMASADVMFVLDVTGSMLGTKIQGLRDAVREFHATVADAVIDKEKTVIRYGFVPYSQSVNTSGLTTSGAMEAAWFAQVYEKQATRLAVFDTPVDESVPNPNPTVSAVNESMTGLSSNNCNEYGKNNYPTSGSTPVLGGGPKPAPTTSTAYKKVSYTAASGKNPSNCVRSKTTTTTTYTVVTRWGFTRYDYGDADMQTEGLIPGGVLTIVKSLSTALDAAGIPKSYMPMQGKWDLRTLYLDYYNKPNTKGLTIGTTTTSPCIEERKTVMNFAMDPVPDGAWDLKINEEPDEADELTKWRAMWRADIYYTRTSPTSGSAVGGPACPAPMRQFEEVDTTSTAVPDWMDTYLNNLVATGSTYHDIGMIWGARLASPKGMFSENVLEGDRNSVSRHIIFMTDGDMEPTNSAYSSYGVEGYEHKVAPAGSSDGKNSVLASYHDKRFLAACRRAKEEGYTVWLIGFGTAITNVMKTCSSGNRAYFASNPEELKKQFRYIAGQVADLRINK